MPTAAEVSGGTRILETVAEFVEASIVLRVFGFGRGELLRLIAAGDQAVLQPLVERGWEALLADANLVTIPPSLLAVAPREVVAQHLSQMLTRAPYYGGTKKATALAHRVAANMALTRATYYQFEKATINKVTALAEEAFAKINSQLPAFVDQVVRDLNKTGAIRAPTVLREYRDGTKGQRFAARVDSALQSWRESYAGHLAADAEAAKRIGFQRALDTLYHFEDKRNPWSKAAQPLSALEMGGVFFTHRHQVLPISVNKLLIEARGMSRQVRDSIMKIITEKVFLQGENPKVAAREILRRFKAELGERWGGAKVSAERIARTETAYILNESTRIAYEEAGVRWVDVIYSEGAYPCQICPDIAAGGPYPINDIPEGGIPFHPNCRCSYSAAFPRESDVAALKEPAAVFGSTKWLEELAKFGFIATATKSIFGRADPTDEMRSQVEAFLGDMKTLAAEAPVITRDGHRLIEVTGYARIEPKRFPLPQTDRFREVLSENPTRDIFDLRKNYYEIGGVIRGNRILYYKGNAGSVSLEPILEAAGGLAQGDILFHTHPISAAGGLTTSIPSDADLRVHLWASTLLGDGARHLISGSDGLRELRVEITDQEKWNRGLQDNWFMIWLIFMEEIFRGIVWWETYGVRRALKRIEDLNIGGKLLVSEPTVPGKQFIPLQTYVAPTRVSVAVLKELERLDHARLTSLYEGVASEQSAPQHRDYDYYIGVLRDLDPSRDWPEAAPTKTRALELMRESGVAVTGTQWSKEELIAHLTGRPVFGKNYLDTTKIDYSSLLGLPAKQLNPSIDEEFIHEAMRFLGDADIERIYSHVVSHNGAPGERTYSLKVAALEEMDPRGDFYGLILSQINEQLAKVDTSRPPDPEAGILARMSKEEVASLRAQQTPDAITNVQKRAVLSGKPIHGVTYVPDLSVVWWSLFFPGYPEKPPINPIIATKTSEPDDTGEDRYDTPPLYSMRHEHFKQWWGLDLRERHRTTPWLVEELVRLDYALHLVPRATEALRSVARYTIEKTHFNWTLGRLIVGEDADFDEILRSLLTAVALRVLRAGHLDDRNRFRAPISRVTFLREWFAVEPWRVISNSRILHPDEPEAEAALFSTHGYWVTPGRTEASNPLDSIVAAMLAYIKGDPLDKAKADLLRDRVFGGDTFSMQEVRIGGMTHRLPVRERRTSKLSRA